MTFCIDTWRSDNGFKTTNTKPELVWPPPVKASTFWTAGSFWMMSTNCFNFFSISWKEMLWSA
jgi:hypothetical protein